MSSRSLSLLALLALTGSCSLVVNDVQVPACDMNEDCAVLNEINGIAADACTLYQCVRGRDVCELSARDSDRDGSVAARCASEPLAMGLPVDCDDLVFSSSVELCNGLDDDCDGAIDERYIDEGDVPHNALPSSTGRMLVSGGVAAGYTGYGLGGGSLAVVRTRPAPMDDDAQYGLLSGSTTTTMGLLGHVRASDAALASLLDSSVTPGCHMLADPSAVDLTMRYRGETSCRYGEVAMGLTEENRFVATISTLSCGDGLLRLGYFTGTQPQVAELGPKSRSNVFFGVSPDMTRNYACTGRSSGTAGAARPSVAAADASGPLDQALVAWLGDSIERVRCGGSEVEVEALAAIVEQDTMAGSPYGWVTASNDAVPQVLGRTRGGGAPGLAVWSNTGYVAGFGDPTGALALSFVDLATRPAAFDRTSTDLDVPRTTAPLTITSLGTIPAMNGGPVDDVAISIGSIRTGGIDVGVVWREGCGGGETIWFRQLFLSRSGSSVSLDMGRSRPAIQLTTAPATPAGPPAIAYVFDGMLAVGTTRPDGRPTGTADNDGGWIVAWADGGRVVGRRVSEADGALLDADELLVLHGDETSQRERPALYVTDGVVHYAYYDVSANEFWGGALTCAPAP